MKRIGAFGIAALAMLLAAAVGSAPAPAAQLCSVTGIGSSCGGGKWETSATIVATSTNFELSSSLTTVTCPDSQLEVTPSSSTGSPITGSAGDFTFGPVGKCKTGGGTSCSVQGKNLPYEANIYTTEGLKLTHATGVGMRIQCGAPINCEFVSTFVTLELENGSPTTITASGEILTRTGGLCPETAEWSGTYSVTSPIRFTVL